jgi:uncharacterized membrane protein required for colicin V production
MVTIIIISVLLLASIALGWKQGFIKGVGALISTIVSMSAFLYVFRHWASASFVKIILVILLFVMFYLLFKLAYWILEKIIKVLFIIPFMKEIDKVLGAILGILAGILAVTLIDFLILQTTWLSFIPWEYNGLLQVCLKIGKLMVIGI